MKAITIFQPYAHLIISGKKRVENRQWYTGDRGPIIIHAGKSRAWLDLDDSGSRDEEYDIPIAEMAFGAIVGVADLVNCLTLTTIQAGRWDVEYPWVRDHPHTEGSWCFILENVRRLPEVIPFRGMQGIFEIPPEILPPDFRSGQ